MQQDDAVGRGACRTIGEERAPLTCAPAFYMRAVGKGALIRFVRKDLLCRCVCVSKLGHKKRSV